MCAKSNLNQLKSVRMTMIEMNLKKFISEKAKLFDKSKIEVLEIFKDKDQFAIPVNKGDEYFYYVGPFDDKNRPFCHYILSLDKVFRREDIDWMTFNLGYNVFKYEGSYGCRHNWVRFRGKEIDGALPTEKQIDNLIQDQIDSGLEQ